MGGSVWSGIVILTNWYYTIREEQCEDSGFESGRGYEGATGKDAERKGVWRT